MGGSKAGVTRNVLFALISSTASHSLSLSSSTKRAIKVSALLTLTSTWLTCSSASAAIRAICSLLLTSVQSANARRDAERILSASPYSNSRCRSIHPARR